MLRSDADQRETGRRVLDPPQVARGLGHQHLERRADLGGLQVAGERRPVAPAEHDVDVQRRVAGLVDADVAVQRGDLDLLVDRDVAVLLGVPVEPGERRLAERADRAQPGAVDAFGAGKAIEAGGSVSV